MSVIAREIEASDIAVAISISTRIDVHILTMKFVLHDYLYVAAVATHSPDVHVK